MTTQDLIEKYEKELLLCEEQIQFNRRIECYGICEGWYKRERAIREFIEDLKKLLV